MNSRKLATSVMLFSTLLGLVVPVSMGTKSVATPVTVHADDASSSTTDEQKAQDIATAKADVAALMTALAPTINDNTTQKSATEQAYEQALTQLNVFNDYVTRYQDPNSKTPLTQSGFISAVQFLKTNLINYITPADQQAVSDLATKLINERQTEAKGTKAEQAIADEVSKLTTYDSQAGEPDWTSVESMNETPVAILDSKGKILRNAVNTLNSLFGLRVIKGLEAINIDDMPTDGSPSQDQLTFSKYIVDAVAASREQQINSLSTELVTDDKKADAVAQVEVQKKADETTVTQTTSAKALTTFVQTIYARYQKITPETNFSAATDADRTAVIQNLQDTYTDTINTLNKIKGYDDDVAAAKIAAKAALEKYTDETSNATTLGEINSIKTNGTNSISKVTTLLATDAEKQTAIKAINDAAAAQKAVINADSLASDAEKATAITAIENCVNNYVPMIQSVITTAQSADTAQQAAVSTIKATTAMHTQVTTTTQRNAAMNAVITAGNTKKIAIQNDTSIAAADKVTAYAAVDKLVASYTDQMKTAKLTTDLAKIQNAGVTAVTAFQATKITTATISTESTANNTVVTSTAKASAKKVLYAISGLKLYKNDTLKGKAVASYAKHKRTNRPTFLVTKTVKNDAGKKVYYVQNQASGKKGYITSSTKSVAYAYYQTTPKKVQVISKGGVNQYKKANLSTKQKHYKKGRTLKVKKLIKSGVTTRFQLTNGSYISANKKFVIDTQY